MPNPLKYQITRQTRVQRHKFFQLIRRHRRCYYSLLDQLVEHIEYSLDELN